MRGELSERKGKEDTEESDSTLPIASEGSEKTEELLSESTEEGAAEDDSEQTKPGSATSHQRNQPHIRKQAWPWQKHG